MVDVFLVLVVLLFPAFHSCEPLEKLLPESCLLIVIGVILGIIVFFASDQHEIIQFNTQVFFTIILPPIIMEAGYFMPTRAFFDQIGTILIHAVLATLVADAPLYRSYTMSLVRCTDTSDPRHFGKCPKDTSAPTQKK